MVQLRLSYVSTTFVINSDDCCHKGATTCVITTFDYVCHKFRRVSSYVLPSVAISFDYVRYRLRLRVSYLSTMCVISVDYLCPKSSTTCVIRFDDVCHAFRLRVS